MMMMMVMMMMVMMMLMMTQKPKTAIARIIMHFVQVRIMEGVEQSVGFTEMDSAVLRALEQWFQSQLQGASQAAAASSSEVDQADALYSLAKLHYDKGTYSAGEAPARQAVEIRARVLGAEHGNTMNAKTTLAQLLQAQGKLDEARPLYEQALEGRRRTLGSSHPDTLGSMWNLATFLEVVKERAAAAALLRECLEGRQRVLGPNHLNTIKCKEYMDELGIK